VNYKIGFIVSEFLPTKNIILKSLQNLNPQSLTIFSIPIYSPGKKGNNKLLLRIFRETNLDYIFFKIFDTIIVRFVRLIKRSRIENYAKKLNIPFHSLSGNITELNIAIENNNIDILVLSTNQIMPKSTLDLPNLIAINVHLAKLPEYGGLFNQFWLMLNDESKSFASVHKASKNLDAGIVLLEDSVDVIKSESLMSLYLRTAEVGGELLYSFLSDPNTYLKVNLEQEKVPHIRGLPTKQDMKKFKSKSLKLIKLKDFFTVEIF
tara:strand:- start:68 stop:859 length:792 start_codon:yes stop_codon:yes gene_type:complete